MTKSIAAFAQPLRSLRLCIFAFSVFLLCSCNSTPKAANKTIAPTKGELVFLLDYDGRLPSEVGFLTNHIMERRLASLLKDSFEIFMSKTKYDRPLIVSPEDHAIACMFYADSDRTEPSATVVVDVKNDAIWLDYLTGDSVIEYADRPSLKKPL
jgi:hypothetical protein